MNDYVYIAHTKYIHVFVNPLYLHRSVGVASEAEQALEIARRFFHLHENYHLSTEYEVKALFNENAVLIGWKISPKD